MALNVEAACSDVSRVLLSAGSGGGIHETLLLSSKHAKKKATSLQTVRLPRSNLLDQVQNFLPQMANANDKLRREMERTPVQEFDIEHVDASVENFIEMNVALVELNGSDTEEEDSASEDDSECEDSSICEEVTVDNIKLPKLKGEGRIEVLGSKSNE
ncbi:NOP protein chaperone 1 isoform X1 [Rhineura floridana]|uniref:NOP protein chaperone 1 isoform X1 n=1 Tax=Rhineura floridana TaxID=261503 RepID=UPI002AC865CD|nr:NOP protein chaperone 1 isoform X1 [Rhineura floridana]